MVQLRSFLLALFQGHRLVKVFAFIKIIQIPGAFYNAIKFSVRFCFRIIIPIAAKILDIRIFPLYRHSVEVLQGDPFVSSADKMHKRLFYIHGIILILTDPDYGAGSSEDK